MGFNAASPAAEGTDHIQLKRRDMRLICLEMPHRKGYIFINICINYFSFINFLGWIGALARDTALCK